MKIIHKLCRHFPIITFIQRTEAVAEIYHFFAVEILQGEGNAHTAVKDLSELLSISWLHASCCHSWHSDADAPGAQRRLVAHDGALIHAHAHFFEHAFRL